MPNLEELFKKAWAPLLAATTIGSFFTDATKWLTGFFAKLLPADTADITANTFVIFLVGLALFFSYQNLRKRSRLLRLERFDLNVKKPEDLVGRNGDVNDLKQLVRYHPLVFLSGDSGSRKSALVTQGLIPELRSEGRLLPIYVNSYGPDWEAAVVLDVLFALHSALSEQQREALDFKTAPTLVTATPVRLKALLDTIADKLSLDPLLILDQLDDYQAIHRDKFLDSHKAWIDPADLTLRNGFWRVVADCLQSGILRLIVVSRSDTTAGLHSISLVAPKPRDLARLDVSWLAELLNRLTVDDGKGPVVADPDAGWTTLKDVIAQDMQRQGTVLPQQLRVFLLGARSLPFLTPVAFRRAGQATGVEALYVWRSIQTAATAVELRPEVIREMLLRLVDPGDGVAGPKTRRVPESAVLAGFNQETAARLRRALETDLQRDELVRPIPAPTGEMSWQLDHDYLARAVLAESRAADRDAAELRDGLRRWQSAGHNTLERWRALLPLGTQLRLLGARLRRWRTFRYADARTFAIVSAVPVLLAAVALGGGGSAVWWEWSQTSEARAIVDQLKSDLNNDRAYSATMRLWQAPQGLRDRVERLLFSTPDRMEDIGPHWVHALVSVEPDTSSALIEKLLARADRITTQGPSRERDTLYGAIGAAAGKLDTATASALIEKLLARADKITTQGPLSERNTLYQAIGAAAGKLDTATANALIEKLLARADKITTQDFSPERDTLYGAISAAAPSVGAESRQRLANRIIAALCDQSSTHRWASVNADILLRLAQPIPPGTPADATQIKWLLLLLALPGSDFPQPAGWDSIRNEALASLRKHAGREDLQDATEAVLWAREQFKIDLPSLRSRASY